MGRTYGLIVTLTRDEVLWLELVDVLDGEHRGTVGDLLEL